MLEIGRVGKAHGLRGEVTVTLVTDRTDERMASGAEIHLGDEPSSASPRRIARARRTSGSTSDPIERWSVHFEGVDDRTAAEGLRGLTLYAEPLGDDARSGDDVFVHELIGKRLVDQHGTDHGEILSVIDNPASDLLELADDALVPLAFYVDHDQESVTVDVPAGLLPEPPA